LQSFPSSQWNASIEEKTPYFEKNNNAVPVIIIITNNVVSVENKQENKQLLDLEQSLSRQFISFLREDNFEYGMDSRAHLLVKKQMKINPVLTKDWLNKVYVNYFNDVEILTGILHVIARFEREEIYPIGYTIATASLAHKNEEVQETAIRAFESWGGIHSLHILENISVSTKWVEEYLNTVISDLKAEYVGAEN
jgi:hypothetical protein